MSWITAELRCMWCACPMVSVHEEGTKSVQCPRCQRYTRTWLVEDPVRAIIVPVEDDPE